MPILPQSNIFAPGPVISGSKISGSHLWRYCPYSTQSSSYNGDNRVPLSDKTYHSETEGRMHTYSLGGPIGWACASNDCSFYLGTTSSGVEQHGRKFISETPGPFTTEDLATLSGHVEHLVQKRQVIAGTRYLEI